MRIKIENTWLTAGTLQGIDSISLNGQQIVDDTAFFRAVVRTFRARGAKSVTLQFTVTREFDSIRLAEKFFLTHFTSIPLAGVVQCLCGFEGDEETLYLSGAVIEAVALPSPNGVALPVQYTIKGGAFTSDVPDDLPDEPDTEDDFVVRRRGSIQLTAADNGKAVSFSSPLESAPTVVMAWISRPEGGQDIRAIPNKPTYTAEGFECDFTGAIPDDTYYLEYIAIE